MNHTASWSAYVEYAASLPDDRHDAAAAALPAGEPVAVVATAPNGNISFYLTVEAPTAERAVAGALRACDKAMEAAYGRAAVAAIEICTEEERDRRNREPAPLPELMGRTEVAEILNVTPTRAGQIIRTKRFQQYAPIVADLAAGPVVFGPQVRAFAEVWPTLPGPKPANAARQDDPATPPREEDDQ